LRLSQQVRERNWVPDPENRAVLFQSIENGSILKSLFPSLDNLKEENLFGENIVVSGGITGELLCIGDILHCFTKSKEKNG
jgi:MOSC domain-containing protein YiiM